MNKVLSKILYDNFTIVTIPGMVTNTIWRWMNLNNIAVSNNPIDNIIETIFKISTIIFIISFIIDIIRQKIISNKINIKHSIILALRFMTSSILWTVMYELAKQYVDGILLSNLAGIGSAVGLIIINLLVIKKNILLKSLDLGIKGYSEGFVWAETGYMNIYKKTNKMIDSVFVGCSASISFTLSSIIIPLIIHISEIKDI